MKRMTVRGSPVVPPLLAAAAIVIVVFGLKYSSDVMAPIFLAATLAILFTPALWWLEKKGLPPWLALVVMVLAGLLLFEHTWAIGMKEAIKNAGAAAITGGLVAPDVLQELEKDPEAEMQRASQE